ncbi:hypothetical protein ARMSODRAFT_1019461 [Armillaria solidipes]|uniref:Tim44-like domain-containing protein n=1 Tax=Armillaria solidipes TaxID=1076256 RepID=A0A2H3C0R4_9AGAR|nr:hypothetical protein ARMSODRAFT_1019461 [Armillaria solidipes]
MPGPGIALSSFLHFAMNLQRIGHNSCLSYRAWTRLPPVSLPHTQYRTIIRTSVAKKRKASIKEAQKDYEAKAKEQQNNPESAINELEKLRVFSAMNPQFDPWALDAPTLDVMIPYRFAPWWPEYKKNLLEAPRQWFSNVENKVKNALCMWQLAAYDSFPGRDIAAKNLFEKYISWPLKSLKCTSIAPGEWVGPLRQIALQTYKDLNAAIAKRDVKRVKQLSNVKYRDDVLSRMNKADPKLTYIWRFHKELAPTKIISIRCTEGHLGATPPTFGNRLVVQALLRFETEQSLEIYNQKGLAVHAPADGTAASPIGGTVVPAKPRRVVEYLTIEKKMYYDTPWYFRDQLWPAPGGKVAIA